MKFINKKRGAIGLLLILVLSQVLPAGQIFAEDDQAGDITDDYIDIIVRYEEEAPEEESLDPRFKHVETLDLLPIQTMSVPVSSVRDISLQENVRRITYDQEVETSQSTYDVSSEDWNQDMIGTFDAWEDGYTGRNVNVAVLDTGFYQHPEISFAGGHSIFGEDDDMGPDPWTNDHSGHGTHVAGILGAAQGTRAQGIAPGIDLYGVKVYHEDNGGKTRVGNLLSGINWAINNGSDIIVISSGYANPNNEVHEMIQLAASQGIMTIAASGNMTDDNATIDYPAAHPEVIAVSGVNQGQAHVSDSMVANENELAAPGQNILSLSTDGLHTSMSGTSQAVPHVAGIAALLMEKYPNDGASAIRKRMVEQALDLGDEGHDVIYGHGLVQYEAQAAEEPDQTDKEPSEEETDLTEEEAPEDGSDTPEETDETDETDGADDADGAGEETDSGSEEDAPSEDETGSEDSTEAQEDTTEEDAVSEEETETDEESEETEPADEPADDEQPDSSADGADDESEEEEPTDQEQDEETAEEETEPEPHRTVWVRPSETNGVATIAEEDIQSVADNGVLAVSFDATLSHVERISLSSEQVTTLKDKNIALLVARADLEWVVPSSNLSEKNALITFEPAKRSLAFEEITKGEVLTFGIEQDGEEPAAYPSQMTYRFFTPAAEYNQDALYQWNDAEENWELLGDAYTKGGVVGVTDKTPTLAVFNPEELETAQAAPEEEEESDEPEDSLPVEEEPGAVEPEEETDSAFLNGDSSGLPVVLTSVVVVLLSVTGGFYFFGNKAK